MKTQACSKTVQGMKVKIESIKKTQTERNLERKNLRTKTVTSEANLTNRIEEMEERISDSEDKIEEIGILVKENVKLKKILAQNIKELWDTEKR